MDLILVKQIKLLIVYFTNTLLNGNFSVKIILYLGVICDVVKIQNFGSFSVCVREEIRQLLLYIFANSNFVLDFDFKNSFLLLANKKILKQIFILKIYE